MKSKQTQSVQIRVVPSTRLTLAEWRSSPELVRSAQKLFASQEFQTMLGVLRNESPSRQPRQLGCTQEDLVSFSFMEVGYADALRNLESLAVPQITRVPLEATFAPEKKP